MVYAASRSGVLVLQLRTTRRPRRGRWEPCRGPVPPTRPALTSPPGWQPPTPATAALSTSGNSWPTSSASSVEQLTLRSRRRGPQRSEDTRRQAGRLIYKEPDSAVLRSGQGAGCGSTRSGKRIWRMQNSWCQRREGRGRVLRSKSRRDSRPPLGCGWHGGGFRYGPAVLGGRLLEVAGGAAARAVAAAAGYRAGRAGDGGSSGSRREPSRPPADRSELHAAQRSAHLLAQRGGGTISHVAIRPAMHPSRLAISRPRQWPDDWLDQGDDADRREAVRWTESRRDAGTPPARFGRWQQVIMDALAEYELVGLRAVLEGHLGRRPATDREHRRQRARGCVNNLHRAAPPRRSILSFGA